MPTDYRIGRLRGEFCVVFNDEQTGRRRRYRLGTRDPKEARTTLQEFIRRRDQNRRQVSGLDGGLTVEDCWNAYITERRAEGKTSVSRMVDAYKRLGPVCGSLLGSDVSGDVARDYIARRRNSGASDGTIHVELGYLRAALRHAGYPARFKLPSKPRPKSRYLTPDEARRLIANAQMPHIRCFISLALYTAGRPSSLLELTWDRCDFERRQIHLDNPGRDRTAKGRATVPMAQELVGVLSVLRESALTNHVIEWAGKPVKSIKRGIQRAASRANLEGVTPYVLRHTAACWLAEAGVPMSEISQYLGHTSTAVTERVYARYSPDHLRKASEAIAEKLK